MFSLLHIPKCAGTSLEQHFQAHLDASRYLRLPQRSHRRALVRDLDARRCPTGVEVFTGHFITRELETAIAGRRPIRRAVLLREPLSLFLSHYNYRMMRYLAAGQRPYPVEYAFRSREPNYIAQFIAGNYLGLSWWQRRRLGEAGLYDLLNNVLREFWFIDDYRQCDRLARLVSTELGIPAELSPRNTADQWQSRTGFQPVREADLADGMVAEFRARNQLDADLYRTWAGADTGAETVTPPAWTRPERREGALELATRFHYQLRRRWLRGRSA
jgi:transposase